MPLVPVGPETAMQTSILGKMPKPCQFFAGHLAPKSSLPAKLPALSILAAQSTRGATSRTGRKMGSASRKVDEVQRGVRIGVVKLFGIDVPLRLPRGALNIVSAHVFLSGSAAYNK
jgi:hypothetical protein